MYDQGRMVSAARCASALAMPLRVRALRALARRALCTGQTRGDTGINDQLKNNVRIHVTIFLKLLHNEITNNFFQHKKGEQEAQVQDDDHAVHTRRIAAL